MILFFYGENHLTECAGCLNIIVTSIIITLMSTIIFSPVLTISRLS